MKEYKVWKQAIFHLEKILIDGEEYYKVLGWENVKSSVDLPKEYLEKPPCFYAAINYRGDAIVIYRQPIGKYWENQIEPAPVLKIGVTIRRKYWENAIEPVLKQAGERLHKMKRWSGKVEVRI